MYTTASDPQELFNAAFEALKAELQPKGAIESMFVNKLASTTVLLELAQRRIAPLDPLSAEHAKTFRQLVSLIASYERAQKFAYTELRRLQAQRAAEAPAAELASQPRLARVALLTRPDGAPRKDAPQLLRRPEPPVESTAAA